MPRSTGSKIQHNNKLKKFYSRAVTFRIQAGAISLQDADANRVIQSTSNYIAHEDYAPLNLRNDIALIELSQPLVFNGWYYATINNYLAYNFF